MLQDQLRDFIFQQHTMLLAGNQGAQTEPTGGGGVVFGVHDTISYFVLY
ncbi:hypothetical protein [Pseudomonas protegens]|nr:hypothetical protein [Pseudomonas protegens]MDK1394855.1 hypothetical protein [Pseudomonas protegens]